MYESEFPKNLARLTFKYTFKNQEVPMTRIKVIDYPQSTGNLREIYDDLIQKRGKLADIHTIQSLRPESIVKHMDLYMEIMYSKSELSRAEREMIAVIVSVGNKCQYCQTHHAEALNNYWKDNSKIDQLKKGFEKMELTEKEMALCEYAKIVTLDPGSSENTDYTDPLKKIGISDNAILDVTLVIAYFNFVNRIVLALNVTLEEDSGTGYKY
jgi:uncharacterized peroxidase-related enzyme